jgi:hypothetical protein
VATTATHQCVIARREDSPTSPPAPGTPNPKPHTRTPQTEQWAQGRSAPQPRGRKRREMLSRTDSSMVSVKLFEYRSASDDAEAAVIDATIRSP